MSVQSANQSYQEYLTTATTNPSGGSQYPFFSAVLPAGTWVIVGSTVLTPSGAGATLPSYALTTTARDLSKVVSGTGPTSVRVPISTIVYADGSFNFTISASCTTSDSGTWTTAGGNILQCYRITNF
jgi:hypothetical protein